MISSEEDEKANEAIERWESINKAGNTLCNDAERTLRKMYGCDLGGEKDSSLDGFNVREYLDLLKKSDKPIIAPRMFALAWDKDNKVYTCGNYQAPYIQSAQLKRLMERLIVCKDNRNRQFGDYLPNDWPERYMDRLNIEISSLESEILEIVKNIFEESKKYNK